MRPNGIVSRWFRSSGLQSARTLESAGDYECVGSVCVSAEVHDAWSRLCTSESGRTMIRGDDCVATICCE